MWITYFAVAEGLFILGLLFINYIKRKKMNQAVQDITDAAQAQNTTMESFTTFINGLADRIIGSDDIDAIKADAQIIKDNTAAIQAAILANTPAQA